MIRFIMARMVRWLYLTTIMAFAVQIAKTHPISVATSHSAVKLELSDHSGQTPGVHGRSVKCSVDTRRAEMTTLVSLTVLGSRRDGRPDSFDKLALVDMWSKTPTLSHELKEEGAAVRGCTAETAGEAPHLTISWPELQDVGYQAYRCLANGMNGNGEPAALSSTVKSGPAEGGRYCSLNMEPISSELWDVSSRITEAVADAVGNFSGQVEALATAVKALDGKLDATRKSLNAEIRMAAIDRHRFLVSDVYEGRVYLVSRAVEPFNLASANNFCRGSGGYLVELDDDLEFQFVLDLVTSVGGTEYFFTGGNDLGHEGHFVYYNSKKAVPNLKWYRDQPDNGSGTEHCMQFVVKWRALNDDQCYNKGKYVCEMPLQV